MARGTNLSRVQDLQAALKRARPADLLSLTECALIWGISKGAFVNVRARMASFPTEQAGPGNSIVYPAQAALKAMLEHETRADAAEQERQGRAAAILGMDRKAGGRRKAEQVFLQPSEMLKLSRLTAELEERERNMKLYTPTADVRAMFMRVFGIQTDFLGQLANKVDPNGHWPADLRKSVDEAGRSALLLIHRALGDMLPPDADSGPRRIKKPRAAAAGAGGKAPVRKSVRSAKG